MRSIEDIRKYPTRFRRRNVLGLPGKVFGRHHHQRNNPKVNPRGHPEWNWNVRIRWPGDFERSVPVGRGPIPGEPVVSAHDGHWPMFNSSLGTVESALAFSVSGHCNGLILKCPSRKPVILEWGCGCGNAVGGLNNMLSKGSALIFGYGDIWDIRWNEIPGVKFLFFVKEHLAEYFRRSHLEIDFIFAHGSLEYLKGMAFIEHLRDLSTVMRTGASIAFPTLENSRPEFHELTGTFHLSQGIRKRGDGGKLPCMITKR